MAGSLHVRRQRPRSSAGTARCGRPRGRVRAVTESASRSAGTGRTSLLASIGTLCATAVGFGRNLALAAAIGTSLVADSYNIANQVPNQVFLLLGGGAIFFVFVPQLIRNARESPERGDDFGSLLLLAGGAFGILVTVVLLAFSPWAIQ